MKKINAIIALIFLAISTCVHATTLTYEERSRFQSALNVSITDTYSNYPNYNPSFPVSIFTDQQMSKILGETAYIATDFPNVNIVGQNNMNGQYRYCAGCNGGFKLDFTQTSIGNAQGVLGVGFDYRRLDFAMLVTYGDDLTMRLFLMNDTTADDFSFFGITSDRYIKSIEFTSYGETHSQSPYIEIDNLTIGMIPEPHTFSLFALGFIGLFTVWLRHKKV